jgi:putative ABC transport system substrate-binding protein
MSWPGFWVLLAASVHPQVHAAVVVAYESGVGAYMEAVEGVRAGMGDTVLLLVDLQAPGGAAELAGALGARDTRLVIAVGARALSEVQSRRPAAPVFAALVLRPACGGNLAGRVDLDVALSTQLAILKALFPHRTRVGIIRSPQRAQYPAEAAETRARKEGFSLVVVECDGAARLLKAMATLKGKVDLLLTFPDPDLYNPVTIKPLILSALENRLPVVGFSPAFVRAGAAAGIYPDYRETGRQVAELALHVMRGDERATGDSPAKVRVAVNERVARLLGIEFGATPFPVEVFR